MKTHERLGLNTRFTAGWIDEDAMGLLKKFARKASPRPLKFSSGVLKLAGFRLLALRFRVESLNAQARKRKQWSSGKKKPSAAGKHKKRESYASSWDQYYIIANHRGMGHMDNVWVSRRVDPRKFYGTLGECTFSGPLGKDLNFWGLRTYRDRYNMIYI